LTLPGLELRPLGRPARSQSLYRLRHPGSLLVEKVPEQIGRSVNMHEYLTRAVPTSQTFVLLSTCGYVIHYGWHVLKTVLDAF
jgi:hypothetical protein